MRLILEPVNLTDRPSIVSISGLGGHAFGSFKERDGNHMWLRDSLPCDLRYENTTEPMARVMIYGYESGVRNSNSFQNLEDLATSFHSSLLALTRAPATRPIIFIAHSLGGLIVKQVSSMKLGILCMNGKFTLILGTDNVIKFKERG